MNNSSKQLNCLIYVCSGQLGDSYGGITCPKTEHFYFTAKPSHVPGLGYCGQSRILTLVDCQTVIQASESAGWAKRGNDQLYLSQSDPLPDNVVSWGGNEWKQWWSRHVTPHFYLDTTHVNPSRCEVTASSFSLLPKDVILRERLVPVERLKDDKGIESILVLYDHDTDEVLLRHRLECMGFTVTLEASYRHQILAALRTYYPGEDLSPSQSDQEQDPNMTIIVSSGNVYRLDLSLITTALPWFLCEKHLILPIDRQGNTLVIASVDPHDIIMYDALRLTGIKAELLKCERAEFDQAIARVKPLL